MCAVKSMEPSFASPPPTRTATGYSAVSHGQGRATERILNEATQSMSFPENGSAHGEFNGNLQVRGDLRRLAAEVLATEYMNTVTLDTAVAGGSVFEAVGFDAGGIPLVDNTVVGGYAAVGTLFIGPQLPSVGGVQRTLVKDFEKHKIIFVGEFYGQASQSQRSGTEHFEIGDDREAQGIYPSEWYREPALGASAAIYADPSGRSHHPLPAPRPRPWPRLSTGTLGAQPRLLKR